MNSHSQQNSSNSTADSRQPNPMNRSGKQNMMKNLWKMETVNLRTFGATHTLDVFILFRFICLRTISLNSFVRMLVSNLLWVSNGLNLRANQIHNRNINRNGYSTKCKTSIYSKWIHISYPFTWASTSRPVIFFFFHSPTFLSEFTYFSYGKMKYFTEWKLK